MVPLFYLKEKIMNYKLLANVNYSILARDKENGILTVKCELENKEVFDEELIVQRHSENEGQGIYNLRMSLTEEEQYALIFNGEELECFTKEWQATKRYKEFLVVNASFESLIEIEVVDKEVYITPPPHEIKRQLLWEMGIEMEDENLDTRDGRDTYYDGIGSDYGFNFDERPYRT
jgi:hypothetical protein